MKVNVEVELVLVGTDIYAEQGQHLMVMNGVCIGVHTGTLPRLPRMAAAAAVVDPEDTPPDETPKRPAVPPRKRALVETADGIKAVLAANPGPMSCKDIATALGAERGATKERAQIALVVRTMRAEGTLAIVGKNLWFYLYDLRERLPASFETPSYLLNSSSADAQIREKADKRRQRLERMTADLDREQHGHAD